MNLIEYTGLLYVYGSLIPRLSRMKEGAGGEPGTLYHMSDVTGAVVHQREWKHAPSAQSREQASRSRDYLASVSPIA